jgi:hypothetical protein
MMKTVNCSIRQICKCGKSTFQPLPAALIELTYYPIESVRSGFSWMNGSFGIGRNARRLRRGRFFNGPGIAYC